MLLLKVHLKKTDFAHQVCSNNESDEVESDAGDLDQAGEVEGRAEVLGQPLQPVRQGPNHQRKKRKLG